MTRSLPSARTLFLAVVLLVGIAAAPSAAAQSAAQSATPAGDVAAAVTESSVLLRWSLPGGVFPDDGFVLTRSGGGATVRLGVPSPLPMVTAVERGWASEESYAYLASVFDPEASGADLGAEDLELIRAFATLTTVVRPELARVVGTLYEDADVVAGTEYRYEVATSSGLQIGTARATPGQPRSLPTIDAVVADSVDGAVHLRWDRPDEATLIAVYDVYREHDGEEVRITDDPVFLPTEDADEAALDPFVLDEDVLVGQRYRYTVEGIDLFGRRTPLSEPAEVTVIDPDPLATPPIEDAVPGDRTITLSWSPPDDPRVVAIGVLRYTDPDGTPALLTPELLPADADTFTDRDVEGGTPYYYALVSVDADGRTSGESALWAARGVNPTPPSAPTGLRLDASSDALELRWDAAPEPDVTSYRVYVSRRADAEPDEFRFADLTADTRYRQPMDSASLAELRYLVRAVNSSDVEGPASTVVTGRVLDVVPPDAPDLRDVAASGDAVTVAWAATADPDVATYRLYRARGDAELVSIGDDLPSDRTRIVDRNVTPGDRYRYAVTALDASGNESASSAVLEAVVPDLSRPDAVTGLDAIVDESGVRLGWTPGDGLSYVVERAPAPDGPFVEIAGPLPDATFVDGSGTADDLYRVRALNAAGRLSEPSEAVGVR